MKKNYDYIEGICHIKLLDFCYWGRKRKTGHWGRYRVIYGTKGLIEDRRECTWNSGGQYKVGYKWLKRGSGSIVQDWMEYWSEGVSRAKEMVVEMEITILPLNSHEKTKNNLIKHKSARNRHKQITRWDFSNHSQLFCFKYRTEKYMHSFHKAVVKNDKKVWRHVKVKKKKIFLVYEWKLNVI